MSRYISFRDFDWLLLVFVLLICGLGVMEIRSATSHTRFAGAHIKQAYWVLGGVAAMFVVSLISYQALLEKVHWLYIVSVASLMSVLMFGHKYLVARRWIKMPVAWFKVLKPYQRARLTSFMQPDADSQGAGYQVNQSLIAVGSGGIWGSTEGSQTHLAFLPVPQTDFIFAAFAEEHGFVGALGVLLLYFIVLMRLTQNAQTAPDRAGTFVVMGVVAVLSFHILVNVGMVVGFMPVTGIPLPLMSYGGSSVLFMFLALGIVMNIRMRRFVN